MTIGSTYRILIVLSLLSWKHVLSRESMRQCTVEDSPFGFCPGEEWHMLQQQPCWHRLSESLSDTFSFHSWPSIVCTQQDSYGGLLACVGHAFPFRSLLLEHSTCAICHDCVCGGWNQSCLASQLFVHESKNHWWLGVLSISCSFYQHSYQDVSRNLSVVKSGMKLPFSRRPKTREVS